MLERALITAVAVVGIFYGMHTIGQKLDDTFCAINHALAPTSVCVAGALSR